MLAGFVNNVLDDVGVLQVLREGEVRALQAVRGYDVAAT